MGITKNDIQKALRIKRCVNEYFQSSVKTMIEAKELMPYFIREGIFDKNHKDGLPIRDFLRRLEEENHLHLIPQAHYMQKEINKNWYFIKSIK